jgi:transcriptional regulator with XRE-family HTH domain
MCKNQINKNLKSLYKFINEKCGTNKGYISKVENNIKDVRISTLRKIVEIGLGGHLNLSINKPLSYDFFGETSLNFKLGN